MHKLTYVVLHLQVAQQALQRPDADAVDVANALLVHALQLRSKDDITVMVVLAGAHQ